MWTVLQISLIAGDPSGVECGSVTRPKPLGLLEWMLDTRTKDLLNVECCFESILLGNISMLF